MKSLCLFPVSKLVVELLIPVAISTVLLFTIAGITVIKLDEVASAVPVTMVAGADNIEVAP